MFPKIFQSWIFLLCWNREVVFLLNIACFVFRFVGGELNACYNAVDRHVERGKKDKVALIHDSPVTKSIRKVTYGELQEQVTNQFMIHFIGRWVKRTVPKICSLRLKGQQLFYADVSLKKHYFLKNSKRKIPVIKMSLVCDPGSQRKQKAHWRRTTQYMAVWRVADLLVHDITSVLGKLHTYTALKMNGRKLFLHTFFFTFMIAVEEVRFARKKWIDWLFLRTSKRVEKRFYHNDFVSISLSGSLTITFVEVITLKLLGNHLLLYPFNHLFFRRGGV